MDNSDYNIDIGEIFDKETNGESYTPNQMLLVDKMDKYMGQFAYKSKSPLKHDMNYYHRKFKEVQLLKKERLSKFQFPNLYGLYFYPNHIYSYEVSIGHIIDETDKVYFPLFFAFKLRQLDENYVLDFLNYQFNLYQNDFISFLEQLLINEGGGLWSKEQKELTHFWVQKIRNSDKHWDTIYDQIFTITYNQLEQKLKDKIAARPDLIEKAIQRTFLLECVGDFILLKF